MFTLNDIFHIILRVKGDLCCENWRKIDLFLNPLSGIFQCYVTLLSMSWIIIKKHTKDSTSRDVINIEKGEPRSNCNHYCNDVSKFLQSLYICALEYKFSSIVLIYTSSISENHVLKYWYTVAWVDIRIFWFVIFSLYNISMYKE